VSLIRAGFTMRFYRRREVRRDARVARSGKGALVVRRSPCGQLIADLPAVSAGGGPPQAAASPRCDRSGAQAAELSCCYFFPTLMIGQLSTTLPGRSVRPLVFSSLSTWLSLVIKTGFEPAFQVRIVSAHNGE
jgi:hypothetical protein